MSFYLGLWGGFSLGVLVGMERGEFRKLKRRKKVRVEKFCEKRGKIREIEIEIWRERER